MAKKKELMCKGPMDKWTAEEFDWAIKRTAKTGMVAFRKSDFKTAGEARFWLAYFKAFREEMGYGPYEPVA